MISNARVFALWGGCATIGLLMIRMPSDTFKGPLPPLTEAERRLEQELCTYVQHLAGQIGERNLFRYKQLVAAATYIRTTLTTAGYEVRRHTYDVAGQASENLEAELRGADKPAELRGVASRHADSREHETRGVDGRDARV